MTVLQVVTAIRYGAETDHGGITTMQIKGAAGAPSFLDSNLRKSNHPSIAGA